MLAKCRQRGLAHVVLDPLRIGVRGLFIDAQGDEKLSDDAVALPRGRRQPTPLPGQEDRAVGLAADKPLALQALDGAADG